MAKKRRSTRRANVEITGTNLLPALIVNMRELTQKEVHIGVQGDAETGMIAGIHEYGSAKGKIPARSFIGSGKKKAQAAIGKLVRAGVTEIAVDGSSPDALYKQIGKIGLDKVTRNFDRIRQPPLSPIYAKYKGNSKILQDQEKLRGALTFVVVPRKKR